MDAVPRPRFHLTAPGWVNDPLALVRRPDGWHAFFQHVPGSAAWRPDCRWGHATSPDLLAWTPLPCALEPGDGDDGCWSGCLVPDGPGGPAAYYTSVSLPGVERGRVRAARPVDAAWTRWEKGPVLAEAPAGAVHFRDPHVRRRADGAWEMLVGGALPAADGRGTAGAALAFAPAGGGTWDYAGVRALAGPGEGALWECPQVVPHGGRDVLVVSVSTGPGGEDLHVAARVLDDPGAPWRRLAGGCAYAAAAFRDGGADGLVCWLRGTGGQGWAGALGVPALVVGAPDGGPGLVPHPAVARARGAGRRGRLDAPLPLPGPHCDVELDLPAGAAVTLGGAGAAIRADADGLEVAVEGPAGPVRHRAVLPPAPRRPVRLLVDGPLLEVFADGRLLAAALPGAARDVRPAGGPVDGAAAAWEVRPAGAA